MPLNKKRKKRRVSSEKESPRSVLIKRIFISSAISAGIFFALLLVLSLIIVKAGVGTSTQSILVFLFAFLSTFLGAFSTFRRTRERGLVLGLACAFPAIIIVCIVLLSVVHDLGLRTLIMSALMLLGGAVGCIVNK